MRWVELDVYKDEARVLDISMVQYFHEIWAVYQENNNA